MNWLTTTHKRSATLDRPGQTMAFQKLHSYHVSQFAFTLYKQVIWGKTCKNNLEKETRDGWDLSLAMCGEAQLQSKKRVLFRNGNWGHDRNVFMVKFVMCWNGIFNVSTEHLEFLIYLFIYFGSTEFVNFGPQNLHAAF